MTRRDRIVAVLAEHPEGLPTTQIVELSGERVTPRQQALTRCGNVLRKMAQRGEVVRSGHVPATYHNTPILVWRLTMPEETTMSESQPEPDVVTDALLERLAADRAGSEVRARGWRSRAESEMREAAALAVVREFLASRIGMSWEEVRAEAEAELAKAELKRDQLHAKADQLREWHRDLLGAQRVMEQEVARLQAQADEQVDSEAG